MRYRVDIHDLFSFLIVVGAFIFIGFFFTACEYPEQKPTVVWELHEEAVNGVVMPSPSPFVVDFE